MKNVVFAAALFALALSPVAMPRAFADADEVKADVKEGAQDLKKGVRKNARALKDKSCELVNGKMECAGKKLKHKAENLGDEVKDKVN